MTMVQREERRNMIELVREYLPGVSDEEAGWILWNRTCFPCGTTEEVRQDLERVRLEMAAPDLLNACEAALEFIVKGRERGYVNVPDDDYLAAVPAVLREAIAKAKGEG